MYIVYTKRRYNTHFHFVSCLYGSLILRTSCSIIELHVALLLRLRDQRYNIKRVLNSVLQKTSATCRIAIMMILDSLAKANFYGYVRTKLVRTYQVGTTNPDGIGHMKHFLLFNKQGEKG